MSEIRNYGELKQAIADWVDREDLGDVLGQFVRLAETEIYRDLRCQDNEFLITLTQPDNPKNPIDLPQNFREMKLVTYNDLPLPRISDFRLSVGKYGQTTSNDSSMDARGFGMIARQLYLVPWTYEDIPAETDVNLGINYYGTESLSEMEIWDTNDNPNAIPENLGTAAQFTERGDNATTRLFLVNPDMYLWGGIYFAYIWLREPSKAAEFKILFNQARALIEQESNESDYAGSTVSVSNSYADSNRDQGKSRSYY